MADARDSRAKIKRKRETGQPWRIERVRQKGLEVIPLVFTEDMAPLYNDLTHFKIFVQPNLDRVKKR